MRGRLGVCFTSLVLISAACGGRMVDDGTFSGADAGNGSGGISTGTGGGSNGGVSSKGGTSSKGGSPGRGGATSGGSKAVGGAASAGGSKATGGGKATGGTVGVAGTTSSGGACACPVVQCPPGYDLVPNPNGCCFHCESQCNNAMCPGIACGSGSHLEVLPGQCCPSCVQDSCAAQRAAYVAFRDQVIEKFSSQGCMSDSDCSYYYEKNNCAVGCPIPLLANATANVDAILQSYAQQTCSPSCMTPITPCDPVGPPSCFKIWCE